MSAQLMSEERVTHSIKSLGGRISVASALCEGERGLVSVSL